MFMVAEEMRSHMAGALPAAARLLAGVARAGWRTHGAATVLKHGPSPQPCRDDDHTFTPTSTLHQPH
jgi:hypothetical protein